MASWKRISSSRIIAPIALGVPSNLYKLKEPLPTLAQYLFRLNRLFAKWLQWWCTAAVLKMCFTELFPPSRILQEKIQLSSSISRDLGLMTCPLSSQPFLSGQLRAEGTLPHIPPYFCPQLLTVISSCEDLLESIPGTPAAPQGWLFQRMLTQGGKIPGSQGFFTDLTESWILN